jgi:hypothetical protein
LINAICRPTKNKIRTNSEKLAGKDCLQPEMYRFIVNETMSKGHVNLMVSKSASVRNLNVLWPSGFNVQGPSLYAKFQG